MVATVDKVSSKTIGKWVTTDSPDLGTLILRLVYLLLIDDTSKENDALSSDDDQSGSDVEILSTPRRLVTRSVSAKRGADKMEEDPLLTPPSLPPTKKAHREAAASRTFLISNHTCYPC